MHGDFVNRREATVLLADDDDDHATLMGEALARLRPPVHLHRVNRGDECLAFLRSDPRRDGARSPDLLILDLNMPGLSGFELLEAIRRDRQLRVLPVVMFTTSANPADVRRAYEAGASSYHVKPVSFDALVASMELLANYWFGLVALPAH